MTLSPRDCKYSALPTACDLPAPVMIGERREPSPASLQAWALRTSAMALMGSSVAGVIMGTGGGTGGGTDAGTCTCIKPGFLRLSCRSVPTMAPIQSILFHVSPVSAAATQAVYSVVRTGCCCDDCDCAK